MFFFYLKCIMKPCIDFQLFFHQHSKSVGILWGVFTVCSAILNIVVFLQEEWIGETSTSKSPGHFGLWRFCTVLSRSSDNSASSVGDSFSSSQPAEEVICIGQLDNFASILSPAFRYFDKQQNRRIFTINNTVLLL